MKALHIVCFDIPFPANYGGVIDVFYRIKALHESGVKVILHCFVYGERKPNKELDKYCTEVHYYQRKQFALSLKPFIVASRANKQLLKRLCEDNHPILFEALHCCYYLDHPALANRTKWVRMHNIEHDYYSLLTKGEEDLFKLSYLKTEAILLKRFEKVLTHAQLILAISSKDKKDLEERYGSKVLLLPAYHSNKGLNQIDEAGDFAFYHGKLSVNENHVAALFLVNEVMTHSNVRLVIAGDGAKKSLRDAIEKRSNISLLEGLSPEQIDELIASANVNLLPTFQPTGIKLKLINCLFKGKHLLANLPMVEGNNLGKAVWIANSGMEMAKQLDELMVKPFSDQDRINREEVLGEQFDVLKNTKLLLEYLN